jgi:hypothetical protein
MGDHPHLHGIGNHDPLHMRADHRRHGSRVAGRFDYDHVSAQQRGCEGGQLVAAHVDAPDPLELALLPGDRLGEGAVDIQSDDAHAGSLRAVLVQNGSWRATRHLLIRARSASGQVARGRAM